MSIVRFERAEVEIVVANPQLASAISGGIRRAITDFAAPPEYPVISLRTFRRLETAEVTGKLVVVRVTERGLRRLPSLVDAIRARGALGVQLVWDGEEPPRGRAEPTIFRVLETARATKSAPPVVVAASRRPSLALRALIRSRP
jgi:hypothetical protein